MRAIAGLTLLCAGLAAAAPCGDSGDKTSGGKTSGGKPWLPQQGGHRHGHTTTTLAVETSRSTTPAGYTAQSTAQVSSVKSAAPSSIPQSSVDLSSATPSSATPSVKPSSAKPSSASPSPATLSSATPSSATPLPASSATPSSVATGQLWQPTAGASWQIILSEALDASGTLDPDVDVFDIDMFGNEASTISALQAKGKKVICYFSAGSYEPYRPDSDEFTSSDLGSVLDGWPDEKWLDTRSANVRNIMKNRIALSASKGCNAIDPDNVDGYGNDNGLGLTEDDAYDYVTFLAQTAASYGLSTGLKNAGDLVPRLVDTVHFSVNEQCHEYNECNVFEPFITANKPVFNIEYPDGGTSVSADVRTGLCADSTAGYSKGLSTILKTLDLTGWVELCDATVATTSTTS